VTPTKLNNLCIRELETAGLQDGKYVAIVGAGPSSPYIPSVGELIEEMSKACGVKPRSEQPTWEFFEAAFKSNEQEYCKVIMRSIGMTPYWDSRTYRHIVAIPFRSFVTFNYDDQLPSAFEAKHPKEFKNRFSVYPLRKDGGLADPCCDFYEQNLVAIHGYRNDKDQDWPKKIILKLSDYQNHYIASDTGRPLFSWWKQLLTSCSCLFIGTSLSEPGIESVVKFLVKQQNPNFLERKHIHLMPVHPLDKEKYAYDSNTEVKYSPVEKTFGYIHKLPYDPLNAEFKGLLNILAAFSKLSVENPEPGMLAPEPITLTSTTEF
jgi:hypothetical protein